jgi:catechol 2,3-dioxygenase-like lactoylglutathione lyase family enzyme
MALKRMDNVGIVVDDLGGTIDFFRELGLELEGRATIEGEWAGRVTGLGDQRVEIAMMRTPDGHGRIELSRFLVPPAIADHRNAPVNALGYLRVMFAVEDIDETLERLRIGSATSADLKGFSSDSPKNPAESDYEDNDEERPIVSERVSPSVGLATVPELNKISGSDVANVCCERTP